MASVENPPLNKIHVIGYSANDRSFPIVALVADPRVAGYRIPEDLSACPDKRYPNHVFTGAQPISGDQRVRHVWEILPSPFVPFTRYDDDLGPVQGRRRSVKNEGQVAVREVDKQVTYEAREGSAIVYTELEETWSIATDEDGNSLFPIRDRDFYDPSRGPVQERRQLFVPTGDEEGSLENVDGVITQTSYEPYNEFLSVKIVQTYKVNGPQLIGKATDNDGQLVTVTTQRKGAQGYVTPNPTATRTVEVSREDAESLVERITETPEIFSAQSFSVERPDPIPQKFRVAVPVRSSQEVVAGDAAQPTLTEGEISRSEEQRNKFLKRTSVTSRDQAVLPQTLTQKGTDNDRQELTITETLQLGDTSEQPTATTTIQSEALGDGNYVITKTEVPEVFAGETFQKTKTDLTPQKFRGAQEDSTFEQTIAGIAQNPTLSEGEFAKSEQQINKFVKRVSTTSRDVSESVNLEEKVLTNEGKIGTRILTLANGPQSFTPSATLVDANVEELGDGRTVKTETTIPEIFVGRTVSVERPDPIPAKFRTLVPVKTDQLNVEGSVNTAISLGSGELSKSEQQVTDFVKRTSTTTRNQTVLPQSLSQVATTEDRQLASVTETLQLGDTSEQPTATVTIQSEAIGDGNYVVTKTEVPEVFSAKVFSTERPDPVPQKFRVVIPSVTEQETIEGIAQEPSLVGGEISKSEQQVNQFVKRLSKTTRDETQLPQSVSQKSTTNEGLLAEVTETLQVGDTTETPTATKSVQSEALGDGSYVVTVTDLPKVFAGETFSVERPDPLPQKFRVAARTLTSQETIAGTADPTIDLTGGQLSKSEQQVTEFVKRTSLTSRDQAQLPITLNQKATDNDRQLVSVTETLQNTDTIEQPTATVTIQSEELGDGNFIVTRSEVPEVFDGKVFSKERPDPVPQKFRVLVPSLTEQQNVSGEAQEPSLVAGDISKSEQQINKFVKRVSETTRATTSLPQFVEQKTTTNEGLLATVKETLQVGDTNIQPSATRSISSEALGDGTFVVTETNLPKVFSGLSVEKSKVDLTPQKFRAAQEDITTQETVAGTVDTNITLGTGEFSKSEQQITDFVKRTSTTTRDITATTTLDKERVLTADRQIATRISTLSSQPQSLSADALLVDGSIEELGDGRTIKTEVRVNDVFANKSFSVERPDPAPPKFRAELPTLTRQETIAGTAETPTLENNEISKSEQQQNEFIKRISVSERSETPSGELIGEQTGLWGKETVTETYDENGDIQVGYKIISNRKTPLGGGKFLGEKIEVQSPIALTETKKDAETGVIFTTTKTLVAAGIALPSVGENAIAEITPIDAYNSIQIITSIDSIPSPETFESSIEVSYPDILEEIGIDWDSSTGGGAGSTGTLNIADITQNGLEWVAQANANATARIIGAVYTKIKRGHRGSVRAQVTRTYYQSPPTNIPTATLFAPVYGTVTIKGKGISINKKTAIGGFGATVTGSSGGIGEEINNFANSVQFGPFCHSSPSLVNPNPPAGISAEFTASAGSIPAGAYPTTSAQAEATASAQLQLAASSPLGSVLTSGYQHVAAVRVEKWRFGIWIQEVYTAFHP